MHPSSLLKVQCFLEHYADEIPTGGDRTRVLEVGSKSYHVQDTYRPLFGDEQFRYTGLDLEAGPNVDLVPAKGAVWDELERESVDLVVSGQTFEHNPFFWVTFAEMARVLSPGGFAVIVAPGAGNIHRYPYDCWRFYPDSWLGLCAFTGLELVETLFESDETAERVPGGSWRDCAMIARKPRLEGAAAKTFYERLDQIAKPFAQGSIPMPAPLLERGPAFGRYEEKVKELHPVRPIRSLSRRLQGKGVPNLERDEHFLGSAGRPPKS